MTTPSVTELITNDMYNQCNYSTNSVFISYIRSLATCGRVCILSNDKNGPRIRYNYEDIQQFSLNLYIVVLADEGFVIVMSKSDVEKFSGLNLWLTDDEEQVTKSFRLNLYVNGNSTLSPNIIITDLPAQSLIHSRVVSDDINNHDNNETEQNIDNRTINISLEDIIIKRNY